MSAVVTGAGQGIGLAVAERLTHQGWSVVGIELDQGFADDLRSSVAAVVVGDVADRAVLQEAALRAEAVAPLHGWVNNAALSWQNTVHEADPAAVDRIFAVNIGGVFWGCAAAVQSFIRNRVAGAIVNVSSVHASAGFAGWAAYDASKGAVEALTRQLAVEYGPVGIRANAVAPGATVTASHRAFLAASTDPERERAELENMAPLRRIAAAREVAAPVAFLLSQDASFITGQVIRVDGGLSASYARSEVDAKLVAAFDPDAPRD